MSEPFNHPGGPEMRRLAAMGPYYVLVAGFVSEASAADLAVRPYNLFVAVDHAVIQLFNQIASRSELFDKSVQFLAAVQLLKGGLFVALLWGAWFDPSKKKERFEIIIATIAATLAVLSFV